MQKVGKAKRFFKKKNKKLGNKSQQNSFNTVSERNQANQISNASKIGFNNPKITSNNTSIFVKKREYITNVVPTEIFTPLKIEFNPGLQTMFPWLSGVAPNFEKYRVHKISFLYETSQSTFIPGMVMMAPEFNVSDSLPDSKSELLEYAFATRAPVWQNFRMNLTKDSIMNYKDYYVRINNLASGDLKLYDPFYLIYCTDAVSTDISYAGELWIEYEIELIYPQRIPLSVLRYNSFYTVAFASPTNSLPLTTPVGEDGGLLVSKFDGNNFQFKESFTGIMNYVIDVSNLGLSTQISTNPANVSLNTLGTGTITGYVGIGGANGLNTNPDWIVYEWRIKGAMKDDFVTISNLGFAGAPSSAVSTTFYFQQGYVA